MRLGKHQCRSSRQVVVEGSNALEQHVVIVGAIEHHGKECATHLCKMYVVVCLYGGEAGSESCMGEVWWERAVSEKRAREQLAFGWRPDRLAAQAGREGGARPATTAYPYRYLTRCICMWTRETAASCLQGACL